MSEYEIGEMMHAQSAQMWEAGQMYFTLVSAYLVVSYLVGAKLTRAQVIVVTSLYLVWIASVVFGQVSAGATYTQLQVALSEMGSIAVGHVDEAPISMLAFSLVQFVGVIASLWFMSSVRHPKIGLHQ